MGHQAAAAGLRVVLARERIEACAALVDAVVTGPQGGDDGLGAPLPLAGFPSHVVHYVTDGTVAAGPPADRALELLNVCQRRRHCTVATTLFAQQQQQQQQGGGRFSGDDVLTPSSAGVAATANAPAVPCPPSDDDGTAFDDAWMDALYCWGYPFPNTVVVCYDEDDRFSAAVLAAFTQVPSLQAALSRQGSSTPLAT